jgi:hypothetical protein
LADAAISRRDTAVIPFLRLRYRYSHSLFCAVDRADLDAIRVVALMQLLMPTSVIIRPSVASGAVAVIRYILNIRYSLPS